MRRLSVLSFCMIAAATGAARAQPVLLSANDGLQTFAGGSYHMREHPGLGTLSAFDLSTTPPRPLWRIPLEQTAIGPPLAIATTPDGRLALIGNPAVLDPSDPTKILMTHNLQVVTLDPTPVGAAEAPLGHHPWSVAIAPDGALAATANGDGTMTLLRITGSTVTPIRDVQVGTNASQNTGVAFSRDGRYLLASRRHDDLVSLFRVEGETITPVRDITVGSNPYEIAVSPNGKMAAVSNIGRTSGDRDSVSLIDLSVEPIRAVGVISVGPTPEGIAFSADSRWLAVNSINGSNLKPDSPFHSDHSLIQLFDLGSGGPVLVGTAETGPNAQGLAFAPNTASLIVQNYAADVLQVFDFGPQGLKLQGDPIPVTGGPSAIAITDVKAAP